MITAQDEKKYYYATNSQFSVVGLVDDGGAVTARYAYSPYGKVTREGDGKGNAYSFTGRPIDNAIGLYNFRNRWYSASLARFVSRDAAGYVDGWNLYRGYFVPNGVDPTGARNFLFHTGDLFQKSAETYLNENGGTLLEFSDKNWSTMKNKAKPTWNDEIHLFTHGCAPGRGNCGNSISIGGSPPWKKIWLRAKNDSIERQFSCLKAKKIVLYGCYTADSSQINFAAGLWSQYLDWELTSNEPGRIVPEIYGQVRGVNFFTNIGTNSGKYVPINHSWFNRNIGGRTVNTGWQMIFHPPSWPHLYSEKAIRKVMKWTTTLSNKNSVYMHAAESYGETINIYIPGVGNKTFTYYNITKDLDRVP